MGPPTQCISLSTHYLLPTRRHLSQFHPANAPRWQFRPSWLMVSSPSSRPGECQESGAPSREVAPDQKPCARAGVASRDGWLSGSGSCRVGTGAWSRWEFAGEREEAGGRDPGAQLVQWGMGNLDSGLRALEGIRRRGRASGVEAGSGGARLDGRPPASTVGRARARRSRVMLLAGGENWAKAIPEWKRQDNKRAGIFPFLLDRRKLS
jgi:hypothetical protein